VRRKRRVPGRKIAGRKNQCGVIITLVAVFMLFVIGAMAALSIDVVTLYTARSEAQLAADAAALAGARVLANSGMTSDPTGGLIGGAEALASAVALQVGQQSQVGGRNLVAANGEVVVVGFGGTPTNPCPAPNPEANNPCITIHVQRTDLPTFFARIWGTMKVTVTASATAEAYNPSGASATPTPVAPMCVKPWLLPNMDPRDPTGATPIFDKTTGAIIAPAALLGWESPGPPPDPATRLSVACPGGDCSTGLPPPVRWKYYPGDPGAASFPPPAVALPTCSQIPTPTPYQYSVAGCIQTPIACNSTVSIDISQYLARDSETVYAVNCLTHSTPANGGDKVDPNYGPPASPFEFLGGANNPIAGLDGNDVMVSDSLVTVPVFDSSGGAVNPATIIGFLQLFMNPEGNEAPLLPLPPAGVGGTLKTTVINMAGCGTAAAGTPIVGNGPSPVAVRLISPP
jgi:putative Flp pilus-assembly TadE/G-like protein